MAALRELIVRAASIVALAALGACGTGGAGEADSSCSCNQRADCDLLCDCDPDCAPYRKSEDPVWRTGDEHTPTQCTNQLDDDGDGLVDCADPECFEAAHGICGDESTGDRCRDGTDNDLDGAVDCEQEACQALVECRPDPPTVEVLPTTYGYPSIPIRGTVEPTVGVLIENETLARSWTAEPDADGQFCVDAALLYDGVQVLNVYAINDAGHQSDGVRFVLNSDVVSVPPANLLAGVTPWAEDPPIEGTLDLLTDGNLGTDVLIARETIWVELEQPAQITRIRIRFTDAPNDGDNTFATDYRVYSSPLVDPAGSPSSAPADWSLIAEITPASPQGLGDGGDDLLTFVEPVAARHLAFEFIENNKIDWFSGERFRVAELSAFEPAEPPIYPTCQTPDP